MKKDFFKGFILGALIFNTVSFATVGYTALKSTFPIIINGETWESEKPAVVIDGSTYLPLKAIGEVLNVKVNWNSELSRVEIGEDFSNMIDLYSRTNPAPVETSQTILISNYSQKYTATISVDETIRGKKAWSKIEEANMFNSEAETGYEYILAKISVKIDNVEDDKAISINGYDFDCYSYDNVKYDDATIVEPAPELDTTLYEGANASGYVVFKVKKTDENPKIVFGQKYDGTGGIWFSLSK